ncbi:hypothetical protein GCM10008927_24970 [Amylibacter ulvae]|uniref:Protein kinase domain-containing protein n=1 Tax=Paramylibacter ulvae TaxID=1651968 RepID=A0ABQ3D6Q9_9RHOB|nr:serine/threonine-protein kinase [Amylibacter ulvae]GHA58370.1 hypothetical protein GCM10008927_24970 [Amylibacter ulvae]
MQLDQFSDPLPIGTTLLQGQYTIEKFLNDGGFGITYLAVDSLDRPMVIKECFPRAICRRSGLDVGTRAISHREEFRSIVKAFVEEARNLSQFEHPNIVKVHQVFDENQTAYMAMDFIDGQELTDRIEQGNLSSSTIHSIAIKLLDALDTIHASGMLHRDISPDNILIDQNDNPVLIDFGAAKQEASQHGPKMTSIRVTKEGYSPQEFYVSGAQQFPSSDLYALGATLYHAITGTAPAESQARLLALAQEKDDPYIPLSGTHPEHVPGLLIAIDRAMNVSPKERLQNGHQWLNYIATTPPKPKPVLRRKMAFVSLAIALVAIGIWATNDASKTVQTAAMITPPINNDIFKAPVLTSQQNGTYQFSNGMEIAEIPYGNNVILQITTPPIAGSTDMQIGDILLAERVLGVSVGRITELENVLRKLEQQNLPKAVFSVRRGDGVVLANLSMMVQQP